ncbi:MAG: hypothetical protein JWP31_715 [Aeromicrobium sp.]|nr:hypothetical protein [Aeromicrobium sp.]
MSDTLPRVLAGLTGSALAAVIVVGSVVGSQSVADDLRASAERALADQGLDGVVVDFAGREAELSGGSRADLDEAETIVARMRGVRRVGVLTPADARPDGGTPQPAGSATIALERRASGTTISGTVRDADTSTDIKAAVADAFGGTVRGDLAVDGDVDDAAWTDALPDVLDELADVEGVRIVIDGSGTVVVDGRVGSRTQARTLAAAISRALPDLELVPSLSVGGAGGAASSSAAGPIARS